MSKPARVYDERTRADAVALLGRSGLAEAHRSTGIPKGTLRRWAAAAGVDQAAVSREVAERTAAATAARAAANRGKMEAQVNAALERIQPKLARVAEGALDAQLLLLDGKRPKMFDAGIEGMRVRDLVGMSTRAAHDLRMIRGESVTNDQPVGGTVVVFATTQVGTAGRPAPTIIDVDGNTIEA